MDLLDGWDAEGKLPSPVPKEREFDDEDDDEAYEEVLDENGVRRRKKRGERRKAGISARRKQF